MMDKENLIDVDMEDFTSAYNSTYSSPTRLSYSENSTKTLIHEPNIQKEDHEKDNYDTTLNSASDIDIRSQEDDKSAYNSAYNSTFSSPTRSYDTTLNSATEVAIRGQVESTDYSTFSSLTRLSTAENHIDTSVREPEDIQNVSYDTILNSAADIGIRHQVESTDNCTFSSPTRLSTTENYNETPAREPKDIQDGSYDATLNSAADIQIRGQDESTDNSPSSSSVHVSNSEILISNLTGESEIQKGDPEKGNSVNNSTDIDVGREEDKATDNNSSSTSVPVSNYDNLISNLTGEPEIQKGDPEKVNSVNFSTGIDVRGREEDNPADNSVSYSSVHLSNSENLNNNLTGKPEIQKEDQQKGNSVIVSTDIDVIGREENNFTDNNTSSSSVHVSNSEKLIRNLSGEPEIQKGDREKGDSVNVTTDIEVRGQEEAYPADDSSFSTVWLSNSEKSIDALTGEPDSQKEDQEKGNSLDCTATEGEILECVNVKEDRERSSETIIVNHQSDESMEMKSKDGEKGDELSDREGVIVDSSLETGDMKTDPEDYTSNQKEESLVLYGTQEPKLQINSVAWPEKASAITKFVKFKSLYAVSNIFHRLSKKPDVQNDSNEKENNIKEVDSKEPESQRQEVKPRWNPLSLIRISRDNDNENKNDPKEVTLESPELKVIKGRIVLYTKLWCQSCKEARLILRNNKLRYSEINLDVYPSRKRELEEITGSLDVPKVFFNQELIGGLNELRALDESRQLEEKIEYVTSEGPSPKTPLPPLSGEDDVSSRGVVDELAVIVRKMKGSIVVKDRFYKFRRVTNCFLGSEAVDFLSEDQFLEREEAIEFAHKLAKELFFRHVLEENIFEDGNHLYRFLDQDPVISQCQNIPRGIIQLKRQPLEELSKRLRFLLYAILDAYTSEDGKHIAYRTIHGSEEFARYLRIAEELQRLDFNKTSKEERLAFFLNLYNLMAIHATLVWGHPEGALDRRKLLTDFKYVIGGCAYSLSDIYNGILRANQRPPYSLIKPFGITDKRFKVALPYPEPLIHFALVSGNRSDPALRCYSPNYIDKELMEAARNFLQSGAFVLDLEFMTISVTKILKWYSVDFGKNETVVLKHAANYLDVERTQTFLELPDRSQLKVLYQPYDWRLNS